MGLWRRLKAWLGLGLGPKDLAIRLRCPYEGLVGTRIRYREARIPKRSGGTRRLLVPDDETKAIQRRVLRGLLSALRAHPCATGFERGKSIVDHARPHAGRAVVIHMDVIDFFPSTTAERVERYFRRIGWNRAVARLLTELTTTGGSLPQGAPTSPRLANLVNFGLDAHLHTIAAEQGARYTRYADDITLSLDHGDGPLGGRVRSLMRHVELALRAHGYRAHETKKRRVMYAHRRQLVTGLVVNEGVRLPRARRRWLRAVHHRHATTGTCTLTDAQRAGWDAYAAMVARATRPA
ncbi:MAG: reverse transcriptase family protein [Planctomycetota bacterium]|nr:reverse transcriptase family protein [Planctomycetota bacterium]